MLRYAITDGTYGSSPAEILSRARRWSAEGVEYVQLRESHLQAGKMANVARAMMTIFDEHGGTTRLLVNHRADVAVAVGVGVHLTSRPGELSATQVRQVFAAGAGRPSPIISASCHCLEEMRRAAGEGLDLVLFGPVFEKRAGGAVVVEGVGLELLRQACALAAETRVLALGGVTVANAGLCMEAGAAGIAGIRLFA